MLLRSPPAPVGGGKDMPLVGHRRFRGEAAPFARADGEVAWAAALRLPWPQAEASACGARQPWSPSKRPAGAQPTARGGAQLSARGGLYIAPRVCVVKAFRSATTLMVVSLAVSSGVRSAVVRLGPSKFVPSPEQAIVPLRGHEWTPPDQDRTTCNA